MVEEEEGGENKKGGGRIRRMEGIMYMHIHASVLLTMYRCSTSALTKYMYTLYIFTVHAIHIHLHIHVYI